MQKSVQITLIIVVGVLILAGIAAGLIMAIFSKLKAESEVNTISAEGRATIKVSPDLVTVYFRAETNGSSAKEAKDKNAEIVNKAIEALKKISIPEEKIQTQDYSIYPEYEWNYETNERKLIGYKAIHSFKVELQTAQIDKVGSVIDAGVDAGAMIEYINFELSTEKQNYYKAIALRQASEDAKRKVEAIASGLGKSLGKLVSVSEISFDYYPWPIYRAMAQDQEQQVAREKAKEAITNIRPSEQEVSARVGVVYEIID
ncbi:MAG: SIMPL domain-containing protein [Candidatus Pacearchaeota archaeon]